MVGDSFKMQASALVGTFTHPNILAFYLVLGLTLYFYILKSNYWKLKPVVVWCMRVLMLNMLVLLIATKTRNAWIACMAGFFVYGVLKDRKLLLMLFVFATIDFLYSICKRTCTNCYF